jgi:hypothetical protein
MIAALDAVVACQGACCPCLTDGLQTDFDLFGSCGKFVSPAEQKPAPIVINHPFNKESEMATDIRDARFYVVNEDGEPAGGDVEPLEFDAAFEKAHALAERGASVRVLYTDEASQTEIMRFVSHGIPTSAMPVG